MSYPIADNSSVSIKGNEREELNVTNKEGFFGRYLVSPTKNAAKRIADGICTLCRNIQSFFISICSPFRRGSQKKEDAPSESEAQQSISQERTDSAPNERGTETAGKPEVSGSSADVSSASGVQSQSDSGNDKKQHAPVASLTSGQGRSSEGAS